LHCNNKITCGSGRAGNSVAGVGMSANVAFLTRLARIADEPVCDEARAARAAALVHAYETVLYGGLGMTGAQRPTARAKEIAKEAIETLRRELLKLEVDAPPASARVFAAVRERIEMARRALLLRVTVEDAGEPASPDPSEPVDRTFADDASNTPIDRHEERRRRLDAVRARLHDRHAVTKSWEALRQSVDLFNVP
jgi:hypothetical protein